MEDLNPEQFKAVTTINGPVLIIAGAGSGKTRVITFRIANMLEQGIPQSQILALTFTNKAAREMEERIKELTGKKLQNLTISTFHAFGVKVLRNNIEKLGWRSNFSIYDETDRNQLIRDCGRELKFSQDALDVYKIGVLFSNIKMGRKDWRGEHDSYQALYKEYQEGLKLYNAVDFDDLIMLPIKLFTEYPEVLEEYRNRYRYIMVDEFQDTSTQQYNFMRLIANENICVVGDDDQSIYSWRGASFENIKMFEKDFPNLLEIKLEQNYRSTGTILAAANGVISHNTNRKEKALWSEKDSGRPIEIFIPENEAAEADFIADMILSLKEREHFKYSDFGVLIRANSLSRALEESFLELNIPYRMSGGTSFFQRKEIKDVISYLRVIANPDDDINLLRIINTPRRGIGKKTIETLSALATENKCSIRTAARLLLENPPEEMRGKSITDLQDFADLITEHRSHLLSGKGLAQKVRKLLEAIEYNEYLIAEFQKSEKAAQFKMMNIESFLRSMEDWEKNPDNWDLNLYDYLNRITLLTRDDTEEEKGEVNIMTIHASKGLEFPVVFIAGAEDGLIPHARSMEENEGDVEEERRLFYVAITRARQKLFITSCRQRRKQGGLTECAPSPFLDEIPAELVEYHEPDAAAEEESIANIFSQMKQKFSI
ncbi:ATP-dependent helicase [Treponema pedis]|uniref:DNA 3'-5' helicase n=1 Tax=Treponema pedis TaxID=409322 RepID=A0A7S7AVE3_9SPIR|nr:UvrD-helicase domain-containing protein [Treponema pedis]QOW60110.1 UvrD-helicase domain-containing protein [Treponema pedis]